MVLLDSRLFSVRRYFWFKPLHFKPKKKSHTKKNQQRLNGPRRCRRLLDNDKPQWQLFGLCFAARPRKMSMCLRYSSSFSHMWAGFGSAILYFFLFFHSFPSTHIFPETRAMRKLWILNGIEQFRCCLRHTEIGFEEHFYYYFMIFMKRILCDQNLFLCFLPQEKNMSGFSFCGGGCGFDILGLFGS